MLKAFYRQIAITHRTHHKHALLSVALLAASLTWTGCGRKETFRIGLAGASTGIFYISWQTFYEGAQLAASEINSQGGVLGRPVELFPTDDQVKVDLGISEMKKLILRDQVHIVVGGSSSHVGAAQSGRWCMNRNWPATNPTRRSITYQERTTMAYRARPSG